MCCADEIDTLRQECSLEERRMGKLERLLVRPWRIGKMTLVELHVPGPTQAELQTLKSG
jgi:hypothetical protein